MSFQRAPEDVLYYGFSAVLLCCLLGVVKYFRQPDTEMSTAPTSPAPVPLNQPVSVTTTQSPETQKASQTEKKPFSEDISGDFYQTIIRNNLFALLGTVLNPTPVVGANLTLLATFLREALAVSTALLSNRTTGRQHTIAVGESIGDFRLTEVQSKNVTLSHNGEEVRLALSPIFFLNAQRR